MSKLLPLSPREIVRRLRRLGFDGPFPSGKHQYMRKHGLRLRVPNPHGADVSGGLIAELLRQASITRDEWESAG